MKDSLGRLPTEPVDRFTRAFTQFVRVEATAGAFLLFCTVIALAVSNSPWAESFLAFWETKAGFQWGGLEITRSLKHWVNDGLLTIFFFVVALELKREVVLGELKNPRTVGLSVAAALGGMALPAGIFLLVEGGGKAASGWGTVMATDTAFMIGGLAVLGSRIPQSLRLFLLSLAIFDDIGAILVVAIGYGGALQWAPLAMTGLGLLLVFAMARVGIRSIPMYFVMGILVWFALDASGIHPTLAGVMLGLMTPARSWVSDNRLHAILNRVVAYPPGDHWSGDTLDRHDLRRASIAAREALSPVERLEMSLHPWVAYLIVPVFALANAGVQISSVSFDLDLVAAILLGFVLGKPIGVLLFSYVAVRLHLAARPPDLSWKVLTAGAMLTGIGFTMALFIAELAFGPDLLNSAKVGILGASIIAAAGGILSLVSLTSKEE
ncbi:MAG: Na+/H+ antiporter NhaA [Bryobacterales bacterium]|nr:Na+/H+ antiporter NhaA [Bryobacterales bacterium]